MLRRIAIILMVILGTSFFLVHAGCASTTKAEATAQAAVGQESAGKTNRIPSADDVTVGKTVFFGSFEQDGHPENGPEPIEWTVLEVKDGKALLLSKYALFAEPYNEYYEQVTWETGTLRSFLNNEFLNEAFSSKEQGAILTTDVDNSAVQCRGKWETDGGKNTHDQIFLLSWREAFDLYFDSDESRICILTPYALQNGAYSSDNFIKDGKKTGAWWLRSPGSFGSLAAIVYYDGAIDGSRVDFYQGAVRPALWLDLTSGADTPEIEGIWKLWKCFGDGADEINEMLQNGTVMTLIFADGTLQSSITYGDASYSDAPVAYSFEDGRLTIDGKVVIKADLAGDYLHLTYDEGVILILERQ